MTKTQEVTSNNIKEILVYQGYCYFVASLCGVRNGSYISLLSHGQSIRIQMIGRVYKTNSLLSNLFFASSSKPATFKTKPIPLKTPPMAKLKKGQHSLSSIAQQFDLNEQTLRRQMLNPISNFINQDQLRLLKIINGKAIGQQKIQNEMMIKKSPVITIMGHVDHGKTTLIDYLRESTIADGEVGGITQKIGAFHITCHNQKITFIDTPGHEAFSNMRRRGASVTDMIVLIVSSTEGVKRQTQEVIQLINRDQIPTIVAISKIDLGNADVQGVEDSLFEAGLNIQPKGGNIPVVHISAKTGQNVSLLSQLILQETSELKAISVGQAEGIVLEAYQNGQGLNAMTLIVKQGTLKAGSILIIGDQYAKIKHMHDDMGRTLKEAKPGDAVQIIGIPLIPTAGDFVYQVEDQAKAKYIVTKRRQVMSESVQKEQSKNNIKTSKLRLNYRTRKSMYGSASGDAWITKFNQKQEQIKEKIQQISQLPEGTPQKDELLIEAQEELINHKEYVYQFLVNIGVNKNNFNVVLKFADRGIEETIHEQLEPIIQRLKEKHSMTVNILKSQVGQVTLADLQEAATCKADVFTFGCEADFEAASAINSFQIMPKVHRLIHTFLRDFEESAVNKKKVGIKGVEKGRGVVAEVYPIKGKKGTTQMVYVPGVRMNTGKISKTCRVFVFRNGSPVTEGCFAKSIKVFKKQVAEVKKGEECTITVDFGEGFMLQRGDEIVGFEQ